LAPSRCRLGRSPFGLIGSTDIDVATSVFRTTRPVSMPTLLSSDSSTSPAGSVPIGPCRAHCRAEFGERQGRARGGACGRHAYLFDQRRFLAPRYVADRTDQHVEDVGTHGDDVHWASDPLG
jgi:hypothetical protein